MNETSPDFSDKISVKIEPIPFSEIPGQSTLFLDYQIDSRIIDNFYPEKHCPEKDFAEKVLANYAVDREKLCDALLADNKEFGARIKTFINIEMLRQKDCVAVVTGQQAGLFSGPVYTIYKALSAVKMARDLREQNIKAVPVFWIAEEDHDFDEVKRAFFVDGEGRAAQVENTPEGYRDNYPVGFVKLDRTIEQTVEEFFSALPHTEFTEGLKEMVNGSYRPGETYGTAFARFMMKLFADYGLILLAPLNQNFKRLCSPILVKALEKSDELVSALLQVGNQLSEENYHAQVLVESDSFPFFLQNEGGERRSLRRDPATGRIKVQNSETEFEKDELIRLAENKPQYLSPNALLRPVVQDFLLPTLVYFGGGAEIAYFAQNAVIYQILGRPVTPIRHRSSFTVLEGKHRRTLEKYKLHFRDLYAGQEKILETVVDKFLAQDTARVFGEVEETIQNELNRLDRHLLESDPTLSGNLANRRKKIHWHLEALRKKFHRAELLKDEVAHRRVENLFRSVFPHNALQERSLNVVPFLNLYGEYFLEWLYREVENNERRHQIFYL
ncbi:MAG: bacillithiol biosynthesis cysteine-adding enzyme BshC [Pyrinomonadaceae bacterium]